MPPGTVGSSTMPQKRNPKLCQDILAAAAEVRSIVPLALEAMQAEHEADRTCELMIHAADARAAIATGDMLSRLVEVLRGLRLDPERMRRNLDLGGGLIMAEAVMLNLGKTIGRLSSIECLDRIESDLPVNQRLPRPLAQPRPQLRRGRSRPPRHAPARPLRAPFRRRGQYSRSGRVAVRYPAR